jgi:hypothetical protein
MKDIFSVVLFPGGNAERTDTGNRFLRRHPYHRQEKEQEEEKSHGQLRF